MRAVAAAKCLLFLDAPASVTAYQRDLQRGRAPRADLCIALRPSVDAALQRAGMPARNTLPYFTTASHASTLMKSDELVAWLYTTPVRLSEDPALQRALHDAVVFWARLVIHHCLWLIEVGSNAVTQHQPQQLLTSHAGKRFDRLPSLYAEAEDLHDREMIARIAQRDGLASLDLAGMPRATAWQRWQQRWHVGWYLATFLCRAEVLRQRDRMQSRAAPGQQSEIWYTTMHYSMGELVRELRHERPQTDFRLLPSPNVCEARLPDWLRRWRWPEMAEAARQQRLAVETLALAVAGESLFTYRDVNFGDLVAHKVRTSIADFMTGLSLWASELRRLAQRHRAPLGLLSVGNRCDEQLLAAICKSEGVPSVLISHGSHVPPKNALERIEWGEHGRALLRGPFSHVAFQSPLTERYAEAFPSTSQAVKTGPLIWGRPIDRLQRHAVFQRLFQGRYRLGDVRVVVHAGTPKATNSLRLHVYETPDEYVQSLCDVAHAVAQLPNTVLVIKFRPRADITLTNLRTLVALPSCVVVSVDETFHDVLGICDVLVSFSSTTIEEALQNHIPVLLYGGQGRYQHVPAQTITSADAIPDAAVFHVSDGDLLPGALAGILRQHDPQRNGQAQALFAPYQYDRASRVPLTEVLAS